MSMNYAHSRDERPAQDEFIFESAEPYCASHVLDKIRRMQPITLSLCVTVIYLGILTVSGTLCFAMSVRNTYFFIWCFCLLFSISVVSFIVRRVTVFVESKTLLRPRTIRLLILDNCIAIFDTNFKNHEIISYSDIELIKRSTENNKLFHLYLTRASKTGMGEFLVKYPDRSKVSMLTFPMSDKWKRCVYDSLSVKPEIKKSRSDTLWKESCSKS